MLWNDVLRFILLISIWFLQHSFISLSLSHEYHITPRELSAIRNSFERYDKDLSGDIPSTDLKYLLQVLPICFHFNFKSNLFCFIILGYG